MTSTLPGEPVVLAVATGALAFAMLAALFRVARGPSLPDRVVAFDLITAGAIGFAGTLAIAFDTVALLDVGLVVAVITFLATIAFAWYLIEREPGGGLE